MSRITLRPVVLSATLALVPLALLGCPALQGATPTTKGETATAITAATQTQSLKTNIAALKSNIRDLVSAGMDMSKSGQQAGSTMTTQSLDRGIQTILRTLAAGSFSNYGTTWTWGADDQLASIMAPNVAMNFAFTGKDANRRTAKANVSKLPDGTVGSGELDITSTTWTSYSPFAAPVLVSSAPPSPTPSPTPSGYYPSPTPSGYYPSPTPSGYYPSPTPSGYYPSPTPSGYYPSPTPSYTPNPLANVQVWYNQIPGLDGLQDLSGKLDVTPQGETAKRINLEAGASSFAQFTFGSSTFRIPTHCYLKGSLPKVALDQTLDIRKAGSTLYEATLAGSITLASVAGPQLWNENVVFSYDTSNIIASQIAFSYENVAQKYKLIGTAKPATDQYGTTGTLVEGRFISTIDNTQLATLSFDSRKGVAPSVTYADGTTETFSQSDFMPIR